MNKIKVNFQNCFGISSLEHEFLFSEKNSVLIYAPNGVMKSSFAKTFECISKGEKPCDRIYTDRYTEFEVLVNDKEKIDQGSIFVANADEDIKTEEKISTLLARKDLKAEYDSIYKEIYGVQQAFIAKLKSISQSTDCEKEIIATFKTSDNDSFLDCLEKIKDKIKEGNIVFNFKYNDIFDTNGNVKKFLDNHKDLIQQYFEEYQKLLSNSEFFKNNFDGTQFGTYQAKRIIDSIEEDAFFKANHKMVLNGSKEITSKEQFELIAKTEIDKIFSDNKLKKIFDKIDKAISANKELRLFKRTIENDKNLIQYLNDYESFKKMVWFGYLSEIKTEFDNLIIKYERSKQQLYDVVEKARKENKQWENILKMYKERFDVPFDIAIGNQEDVILRQFVPNLIFKYKDNRGEDIKQEKNNLMRVLSRGELRAFYILQLLFELEARKKNNIQTLVVFDDIADSFDYKNKYAIIEYLNEINNNSLFRQIILTHNFDFYRTVCNRLYLGENVLMTIKRGEKLLLINGKYRKDYFKYMLDHCSSSKTFISIIPFARNIVQYITLSDPKEYSILTSCLHIREDSDKVTVGDVKKIFNKHLYFSSSLEVIDEEKSIIDFIKECAKEIVASENTNEIDIENKLVLSICIRLLAEEYIISKIGNNITVGIDSNQTSVLIEKFCKKNKDDKDTIRILSRVNLITPEYIHVNSFMYEPLIDTSVHSLIKLYQDVLSLSKDLKG